MSTPAGHEPDHEPDRDTGPEVGWGILATGKIARSFAADLALTPGARLVAAGSRTREGAEAFCAEYGGRPHGSYAELVADPEVEVVYVASPHSAHLEHARLAFESGKHVLCEKPLALTVADAEEMVALAARHDRFLMEAMWTACHPVVRALVRDLAAGAYGVPRHLHAELGFVVGDGAPARLLDPALGAGALLDMGIYPLTLAHLLLGEAEDVQATATLTGPAGAPGSVDLDVAMAGRYPGGALATMTASMTSWSSRTATIATDRGRIELANFHHPTAATFTAYDPSGSNDADSGATPQPIEGDEPVIGRGYGNEALEVGRCVRAGLRESPLVPHAQTLLLMRQMADVLARIGVVYEDA